MSTDPQAATPNDAATPNSSASEAPAASVDNPELNARVVEVMRSVFDPEIPVNIYELGMVYGIAIDAESNVVVTMTLTSPSCPAVESLPAEVEMKLNTIDEVKTGRVELVWEPTWTPEKMSDAAKLELGMM